jgi:hypothetical protein
MIKAIKIFNFIQVFGFVYGDGKGQVSGVCGLLRFEWRTDELNLIKSGSSISQKSVCISTYLICH